jgi:hypothetical protein
MVVAMEGGGMFECGILFIVWSVCPNQVSLLGSFHGLNSGRIWALSLS